jgi:hypothetical protein
MIYDSFSAFFFQQFCSVTMHDEADGGVVTNVRVEAGEHFLVRLEEPDGYFLGGAFEFLRHDE